MICSKFNSKGRKQPISFLRKGSFHSEFHSTIQFKRSNHLYLVMNFLRHSRRNSPVKFWRQVVMFLVNYYGFQQGMKNQLIFLKHWNVPCAPYPWVWHFLLGPSKAHKRASLFQHLHQQNKQMMVMERLVIPCGRSHWALWKNLNKFTQNIWRSDHSISEVSTKKLLKSWSCSWLL